MIIDREISKYIVFSEDTIIHALEKISKNKHKIIFTVNESGVLEGVMTDGDFRRWLLQQTSIDLHQSVFVASNKNFIFCKESDPVEKIHTILSDTIDHVAILDDHSRLVAVATSKSRQMLIEGKEITEDSPCFVIAEIGNNHNGDLNLAKKMIDEALWAGADCVKFQMRDIQSLYRSTGKTQLSEDLGTEYVQDLLAKFQLSPDELFNAFDYCRAKGGIPLCTPWDLGSLEKLKKYGMQAYKVASADLTNHELLEAVAQTNKPMFCSVGMSNDQEIISAVELLQKQGALFALLQCNSTYPPPIKDINLAYLQRLKKIGNCLVGYSGHEHGINVPIAAVSLGAKIIEKHFTLDKNMEGNDHKISLLPDEFKLMVKGIHEVSEALGQDGPRHISQGELINRENLSKSLIINRDLKKGERIEPYHIEIRSPGQGLPPYRKQELIGKFAKRDLKKGDFFHTTDINGESIEPRKYDFNRPWGIPVRFHDAKVFYKASNIDLFEFHLSYKDLSLNITDYFDKKFNIGFVIHCPELFSGDHILDLCAESDKYRNLSLKAIQDVIDLTRQLNKFFPKTKKPLIVTNVGGFSKKSHKAISDRAILYERLGKSLKQLDLSDVEIIPQTMPPFPWHFGGQRYHNIFVDPHEIANFCKKHNMRICLDVSHSKLACNFYNWSFTEFLKIAGPYTAHLHLADAKGVDGEGLQIGDGDIDFYALGDYLNQYLPKASFIPEIWQGHKNNGEGFFYALNKLELTSLKA